jgi:hypothetical protein
VISGKHPYSIGAKVAVKVIPEQEVQLPEMPTVDPVKVHVGVPLVPGAYALIAVLFE